jgi:DNA-binding CsgD family transcriptional regulator
MATQNEAYDANRIELSPTQYKDNDHYVVSRDKSGSYTVYVMDAEDWDNLPLDGDGPSYVFDGDLKDYGAEPIDADPYEIETYELATLADELHKIESGEVGVMSERFWETIWNAEPREAVYVGEGPGYNNADNRPRAEIYDIAGHAVLNVEDYDRTQLHVVDGADEYDMLYDAVYPYADDANGFGRENAESMTAPEGVEFTFSIETVGMIGDAVARDLAEEFEHAEYEPRETYLSDQEFKAWVLTRVRDRSYESTAQTMDVGVETVKTYISRISKKKARAQATLELLD